MNTLLTARSTRALLLCGMFVLQGGCATQAVLKNVNQTTQHTTEYFHDTKVTGAFLREVSRPPQPKETYLTVCTRIMHPGTGSEVAVAFNFNLSRPLGWTYDRQPPESKSLHSYDSWNGTFCPGSNTIPVETVVRSDYADLSQLRPLPNHSETLYYVLDAANSSSGALIYTMNEPLLYGQHVLELKPIVSYTTQEYYPGYYLLVPFAFAADIMTLPFTITVYAILTTIFTGKGWEG